MKENFPHVFVTADDVRRRVGPFTRFKLLFTTPKHSLLRVSRACCVEP